MIRDLSETLRALLDDPALSASFPELAAAQIVFDRPAEGFNPSQTTIDLFLFDVRENEELRTNEPTRTRVNGGVSTRRAPLRVACSYLLTAWPTSGADLFLQEHRLLSQALQVLARHPQIPAAFLKGGLVGQEPPLPLVSARTEGLRDPHEFWASIGNKMRAAIIVTATIGMDIYPAATSPEVRVSQIHMGSRAFPDAPGLAASAGPPRFRIGGRVADAAGHAVVDASVSLVELGLAAKTDEEGHYQLGAMTAGTYTVRVHKDASVKSVSMAVPPVPATNYDVQL
jgi:hypothetical protein